MTIPQIIKFLSIEVVELQELSNRVTPLPLSLSNKLPTWLNYQHSSPKNLLMIQVPRTALTMVLCLTTFSLLTLTLQNNWNRKINKSRGTKKWPSKHSRNLENAALKHHNSARRKPKTLTLNFITCSKTLWKKTRHSFCKRSEISTRRNPSLNFKELLKTNNLKTITSWLQLTKSVSNKLSNWLSKRKGTNWKPAILISGNKSWLKIRSRNSKSIGKVLTPKKCQSV